MDPDETVYLTKEYDEATKQKFDEPARLTMKKYLTERGIPWQENPDKFAVDFIIPGMGYMEVEIKTNWDGDRFTFHDLQVTWRKRVHINPDTVFCIFNKQCTQMAVFPSEFTRDSFNAGGRILRPKNTGKLEPFLHTQDLKGVFWDKCEPQYPF
jgi:hypothetical protein